MSIKRREFLKGLGAGAAAVLAPCLCVGGRSTTLPAGGGRRHKKPNFVLILVDDLGWTDLACFGSKYYRTANIDRLASQGMKFTDAYAACAVCSPTRAAVMTGRYPARVGVTDWIHFREPGAAKARKSGKNPTAYVGGPSRKLLCPPNPYWMDLDEVTIAEMLRPAGYATCHIGKWHLGPEPWYPGKQGFDINVGGCDFGAPPSYFDPYSRRGRGGIPTLKPRKKGRYLTDRESDEAVAFIREHRAGPFFLNMCHYAVHTPLQAKKDLVAKYKARKRTNQKNPTYAAMVQSVDDSVGRITAVLDELGLADSTMVIFTSDNGGLKPLATDNAPLRAGKGYPYEGGIRVPLIVRRPAPRARGAGIKAGSVSCEPVTSVDYFPTICAAAGVKLPDRRVIDGEDLTPALEQTGRLKREAIYWHFPHYRRGIVPYSIVRAGRWKLIRRYEGREFELFDLKSDIGETNDLSAKMPEKVKELNGKLTAWLKRTGAKLPRPNPDYDPDAPGSKRQEGPKRKLKGRYS